MGRERHILLAGLGLLTGTFVGVLSIKLLSPRPPLGAGADIHDTVSISTAAEIVEPPALSLSAVAPSAISAGAVAGGAATMPTVSQEAVTDTGPAEGMTTDRYPAARSGFAVTPHPPPPHGADEVAEQASDAALHAAGDPFVRGAQFDAVSPFATDQRDELADDVPRRLDAAAITAATPLQRRGVEQQAAAEPAVYAPAPGEQARRHEVTHYVAVAGDSWWSLAERIYGDGRYYRALFAWNRAVNPRVSLVPGTALELPPLSKLAVAWPALVPDE